ncbi:hypothetical protein P8452_00706 [Trifolium repens]|nr:hypothetical protein P8452_00706 [Trifolium repens]
MAHLASQNSKLGSVFSKFDYGVQNLKIVQHVIHLQWSLMFLKSNKITLVALFVSVRVSTIYSKDYILMIHCKNESRKLNALTHKIFLVDIQFGQKDGHLQNE